jgi:hypothetical protein
MTPRRPLVLLAAILALLAATPAGSRTSSRARLDYAGYLTDSQVLSARLDVALMGQGGPYRLDVSSGLVGVLGRMIPFRLSASSQGQGGAAGPHPSRYSSDMTIYEERRSVKLIYGANGAVKLIDEPPTEEGQQARARGLLGGTVDPLSAALAIADSVARHGRCGGVLRVFDGARRYDLTLSPAPAGLAPPRLPIALGAPPIACDAAIALVSGFAQNMLDAGMYPSTLRFWLAPGLAGPLPALLRLEAQSGLGQLRLDLRAVFPLS